MKILSTENISISEISAAMRRAPCTTDPSMIESVRNIIASVRTGKDAEIRELTTKFDKVSISNLKVTRVEIEAAYKSVPEEVIKALNSAKSAITKFHSSTIVRKNEPSNTVPGVFVWQEFRPIEKVGLYIPGGKAAYPSTVLMLGVPAQIAGCKEIVMCVPPLPDGSLPPSVLVAADLVGISNIFKVGGAQAIAAMAYGTETIPKVSKVFGPGNAYVTIAKILLSGDGEIAIDLPAGPSEVAVIADTNANPKWVAADLLSQLEHDEDSQALLVTFSEEFARAVIAEMEKQTALLPRKDIIKVSMAGSFAVVVKTIDEACVIANEYASEHLEIVTDQKSQAEILTKINNAGSIFLGKYSSEPLGDYATGSNHVLPTSGFAKAYSALSTSSFGRMIQVQTVSEEGITNLRKTVETLAKAEGLQAHGNAVSIRFSK